MQKNMLLKVVVLLVGMSYMVSPSFFVTNTASDDAWPEVEEMFPHYKVKDPATPSPVTPCPPLKLPESQPIAFSAVRKNMFSPVGNRRSVPKEMKAILLPSTATQSPLTPQPKSVQLLCHIDRIYVRVQKSLFSNTNAEKYLKVGTCLVNKDTPEYYYFLYPISSCNVQRHVCTRSSLLSFYLCSVVSVIDFSPISFFFRKPKTMFCIPTLCPMSLWLIAWSFESYHFL